MPFERLSDAVQTLYAELLDQCSAAEAEARAGTINRGSFVSKTIGGATYWYIQQTAGAEKRQTYLGRESPELLQFMHEAGDLRKTLRMDEARRRELVNMLAAGGAARETGAIVQALRTLGAAGMFRGGGVLVGTQAFNCYANMLGVKFEAQTMRTADIDIAHDVAAGTNGWAGVPGFNPRNRRTSLKVRGRDVRISRVPPATEGIDYLIADSTHAVIVGGSGVFVNVPSPAWFALHKLWVARQRNVSEQAKARKDLRQAEQLLEVLAEDRPGDLTAAWRAAEKRPAFAKTIAAALRKLGIPTAPIP